MPIETTYAVTSQNELEQSQTRQTENVQQSDFSELLAQESESVTVSSVASLSEKDEYASAATETLTKPDSDLSSGEDTELSAASVQKPCIAQFMVMTGCDFKTASQALYQYENWQDYLTEANSSIPDLSEAQQQLQAEREDGSRSMLNGSYGARNDYVQPDPPVVENPGEVLPCFNESGTVSGLAFYDAEGTEKGRASFTDRETILAHTDGFHIGRIALDNFAQKATGDARASFDDLDLHHLAQNFLSYAQWSEQYGLEASANGLEELAAQAESAPMADDLNESATVQNSELALLMQRAQMTQIMNAWN